MKKIGSFNPLNLGEQSHFIIMLHHAFSIDKHHVKVTVSGVRSSRTDTELNKYPVLQHHRLDTTVVVEHNGSVRNYKERAVISGQHLQNHSLFWGHLAVASPV